MAEVEFPQDFDDAAMPVAHHPSEIVQGRIRDHIIVTNDMRLFGLLHPLGQTSARMEQVLWSEQYERIERAVEEALKAPDNPGTECVSHEEVTQAVWQKIDAASNKPC